MSTFQLIKDDTNRDPWNKGKLSGAKAPPEATANLGDSDSIGNTGSSP